MDVLRRAEATMTAREIADALIADKALQATRKQAIDLQAAILVALRPVWRSTAAIWPVVSAAAISGADPALELFPQRRFGCRTQA